MVRCRRDTTFRKTDLVRAIRAALAVGISNLRIEIDVLIDLRLAYVGDVLEKITGPVFAGCFSQPVNRSVRYAWRSGL